MSLECELPAVHTNGRDGVAHAAFKRLWDELADEGWRYKDDFTVYQPVTSQNDVLCSDLTMTTDSGPTIEIAPSPSTTIREIESQLRDMRSLLTQKLQVHNIGVLGSGVHPYLGTSPEEYYNYRTPRQGYDYAIRERGIEHRTILNIAATQEVIDVPFDKAVQVASLMHRLAGVVLFLCRNDPEYRSGPNRLLSVRPRAWREHVPKTSRFRSDETKVWLPATEVRSWRDYASLLWTSTPMFVLGTKNGAVYIPEHPTFAEFVTKAPDGGWEARKIGSDETIYVEPEPSHIKSTDWSYMGMARIRFRWNGEIPLQEIFAQYLAGEPSDFDSVLQSGLTSVMIENRSSATPRPGEEMCSLAFVLGLIENLERATMAVNARPYSFWLDFARAAEMQPLASKVHGVDVQETLTTMLDIAADGLARRDQSESIYLEPLYDRIARGMSQSEEMLAIFDRDGIDAIRETLLYK